MKARPTPFTLKEYIVQRIRAERPRTVRGLFGIIKLKSPIISRARAISEEDFVQIIKELEEDGVIELQLPVSKVDSYLSYLTVFDENLWFYLVALVATVTLLTIYVLPSNYPIVAARWIVGSIFVLFLPGFVTIQTLFPEGKELGSIERFALTIGLSLAITPLIGLILNYTPWGIRLNPIVTALSMFTLGIGLVGTVRRYKIALREMIDH